MNSTLKLALLVALAGGASYYGAKQLNKLQWMQDNPDKWYLPPAALAVVALFLRKRSPKMAIAILASAVVVGAVEYNNYKDAGQAAPAPAPAPAPAQPPAMPAGQKAPALPPAGGTPTPANGNPGAFNIPVDFPVDPNQPLPGQVNPGFGGMDANGGGGIIDKIGNLINQLDPGVVGPNYDYGPQQAGFIQPRGRGAGFIASPLRVAAAAIGARRRR